MHAKFLSERVQQKLPCFFCSGSEGTLKKRETPLSAKQQSMLGTGKGMFLEHRMSMEHPAREGRPWSAEKPWRSAGNMGSTEITKRKIFGVVTKIQTINFVTTQNITELLKLRAALSECPCLARTQRRKELIYKFSGSSFLTCKFVPSAFTQIKSSFQV